MSPSKAASRTKQSLVPLATLIGRELRSEKLEKPLLIHGQAALAKKGEDFFLIQTDCERIPGDPSSAFSVFGVNTFSFLKGIHCVLAFSNSKVVPFVCRYLMVTMVTQLLYILRNIFWTMW